MGGVKRLMTLWQILTKSKNELYFHSLKLMKFFQTRTNRSQSSVLWKVCCSFLVKLQVCETFSEEVGNYFSKIKSAVRKSVQIQWSAGFEILPWRGSPGTGEHLNWQMMRRRVQTVFIMSWEDSTGHCWFLYILCWPFTLHSSLCSCDLQRRAQEWVIKVPSRPCSSHWNTKSVG